MGISNCFTFDGKNSKDFGILIEETGSFRAADRDYETVAIPGRSGELTIDNGRYKNVDLTYKCGIGRNFETQMDELFRWLMSNTGYKRLEDTYQPDVYRMARIKSAPSPSLFPRYQGGRFDVQFDCRPQRWLKEGEKEITLAASNAIDNPTYYDALPVMYITGNGTIVINDQTITIAAHTGTMVLDFEIGDAYESIAHTNYNQYVTLTSDDFPVLVPGVNNITKSSGLTVTMKPRWWTI